MVHGGAVCQLPYTFTRPKRARVEATYRVPLKGNCDSLCVHWGFANKVPRFKSWQYLHAADSLFLIVVFAYRNRQFWNKKIYFLFYIWFIFFPHGWPRGFNDHYLISPPASLSSTREEGLHKWHYQFGRFSVQSSSWRCGLIAEDGTDNGNGNIHQNHISEYLCRVHCSQVDFAHFQWR